MSITPSKYIKENRKKSTFNFKQSLTDRIGADTFNTDIEQFNKDYSADYLSNWHSAEDINTYYDRLSSLNDRTKAYQSYVNLYGTDEQKSVLGDIGKQISAYDEMIGKRQDVLDYYGTFKDAEAYSNALAYETEKAAKAKAEQERIASLDVDLVKTSIANIDTSIANYEQKYRSAIAKPATTPQEQQSRTSLMNSYQAMLDDLKATKSSLEADITAKELHDRNKMYTDILGSSEFASFVPTDDDWYDSVEMVNEPFEKTNPNVQFQYDPNGMITTNAQLAHYGSARYEHMTDDEYKLYKYLQEMYGQEVAAQYAYDLDNELISRYQESFKTFADEHPILGTIASFGTSALQGVDFLTGVATGNVRQGELTAATSALREGAVSDNPVDKFIYNTVASGVDSAIAAYVGNVVGGVFGAVKIAGTVASKVASGVGSTMLGLSAASSTSNDILARGGTADQAITGGIAAGFFEGFFESFSISQLQSMQPEEIVKNFKVYVSNVRKSVATNASEELATEVANIIFDTSYMGELSNVSMMLDQYRSQGLTEEEAKRKVAHNLGVQVLEAAASGALIGGGMTAIGGGVGLAKVDKARRKLGKSNISGGETATLIKEATEYFKGEEYKEQQALIQKVEKGLADNRQGRSQQRNIGKLIEAYVEANYKEQNRELAEDSVNNIEKTKKTIENEATKTKVDNTTPTITNDNLPKILGFKEGKLSETVIETENGATAFTEESVANADIGTLYACAIRLGNTQSANNFVQNWDGKTDPFQYYLDFLKFQMRGTYAPDSYDKTMTDYAGVKMSPAAKHAAFQSGISLRESTKEKIAKQSEELKGEYEKLGGKAKKGKFNDSKLNYSALTKEQKDVVNFTRILSDYLGVNVEFFVSQKGKRGANGYYKAKNNTIYLDIYAGIGNKESYSAIKDCLINTMSHEIVHNMKVTAPTEYAALRDFIIDKLSKQEGYDLDAKIEQIIAENSDQGFTVEDAIEEIVAMSCEDLLGSSEKLQTTLTEFYAQNEKAANSFNKFVREVLNRLKAFFEKIIGKKSIAEESRLMAKQSVEFISELQKRYDAALLAMREGNAVRNTQNATEGDKVMKQARMQDEKGNDYWQIESEKDIFQNLKTVTELQKAAYQFILHGDKGNKVVGLIDGRNLEFIRISAKEYVYGRRSTELSTEEYKQKMRMSTSIIDLIENAFISYDAPDHKNHTYFPNGFKNYQGRVGIDKTIFRYIVRIGKAKDGAIFYDIYLEVDGKVPRANRTSLIKTSTSNNKISQPDQNVNPSDEKTFEQKRTETTTNRELLANALESTIDTSTEEGKAQLERLKDYKASVKRIATLEKQRAELVEKGMELMRKKGRSKEETAELTSIWEKTKSLEKKISLHDKELLRLEALKPIQTLLEREKAKAVKKAKKQGTEKQKEIRENYARREYIKKIEDRAKGLNDALTKAGKKHVPEPFKEVIAEVITAIDFSSKRKLEGKGETKKDVSLFEAFSNLANLLNGEHTEDIKDFLIACDITDEFAKEFLEIKKKIDDIAKAVGTSDSLILRQMTSEQLRQLNSALYKLSRQISEANKLMENKLFKNSRDMSIEFMRFANKFATKEDVKWLEKLLDVDNLTPYYAFKRMGKVGMSLFNEWADGWDTYSKLSKDIIQFTKDLYTSDEVKKWTNEVHEFDINGDKYYLTTAHLMSFYLLHKQKDSRQHIEGYGIVVETFKTDPSIKSKQIKGKTYTNNSKGTHITQEVALRLLTELDKDKRAKEVADKLQNFMATDCADWANYITMRRFGEKAYTIEDYFPIESSKNEMNTEQSTPNLMSLYALLNKSFTKARVPKANNKIMIRDVFDVFTTHTTEVAAYRSFGLPLLDMLKFYNFRQTHINIDGNKISNSVKASIEDAFGEPFKNYLETFIRDVTGTTRSEDRTSEFTSKLISRYKIAAVAGNVRVIALQGTAYFRASAVLKHRYLLKEVKDTPQLRRAMKTMQEYSGIALWKNDLGFRDVNITNSLADKIKHKETITDKITEGALKGAALADNVTWASIWLACENEIKDTQKQLTAGSTEFYEAVALRFREVIYATQVVDSPLAKSQVMRSKSAWDKIKTSFMAEPTTSYNLLVDAYHEIADTKRRGEKVSQGNYLKVAKLVVTYVEGAVAQAVIESLIDAMRKVADDEDEELIGAYWEEVWQNTIKELSVFRKLPILKSISEAVESNFFGGYAQNQNMDVAVIDRALQGIKEVVKFINGESSITKLIKKIFNAISSLTGIPISNTYREIKTLWNNAVNMFNGGDGRIE